MSGVRGVNFTGCTFESDVNIGELGYYITDNVQRQSVVVNRKSQTPVTPSATMEHNWKNKKLNFLLLFRKKYIPLPQI